MAAVEQAVNELQAWRRTIEQQRPARDWMTTSEAAAAMGRERSTIALWCQQGQLDAYRTPGGKAYRIPTAAVSAWLAANPTTHN